MVILRVEFSALKTTSVENSQVIPKTLAKSTGMYFFKSMILFYHWPLKL